MKPWVLAGLLAWTACAHQPPGSVVGARELPEAHAGPRLDQVVELGGGEVPAEGAVQAREGDGVAVVGEGLWLRGQGFGRQPTVFVGGVAAPVLVRTADGGIVVRVPPGAPTGAQPLEVRTRAGRTEATLTVRRFLAAGDGAGALRWFAAGAEGQGARPLPEAASPSLPPVRRLAFSSDGRAAYVVGPEARLLSVMDMAAPGGPQVQHSLELEGKPVRFLLAASQAPVLVLVRDDDVLVFNTVQAARPPRSRPRPLPAEVRSDRPVAAAVSPDGRWLALALDRDSRVLLLSLQDRTQVLPQAARRLTEGVRVETVHDLAFGQDGQSLWLLLQGATRTAGGAAPRVVRWDLTLEADGPQLAPGRVQDLVDASVPTALGVSRTRPLPSGAAIRRPPSAAQVLVGARLVDGRAAVYALDPSGAQRVPQMSGVAHAVAFEPLGHWAYLAMRDEDRGWTLAVVRADRRGEPAGLHPLWPGKDDTGQTPWLEVQP